MESNKDEAARCIGMAKIALASGDKQKARKFIRIAQRLNPGITVEELQRACGEGVSDYSASSGEAPATRSSQRECSSSHSPPATHANRNYTEDHVKLIKEIRKQKDYYAILGVEKSCSVEDIRKAYRKLSLKVHPDKNKAPGSEEAFKTVCTAFQCLSNEEARRQYDTNGLIEESELNQNYSNVRRRRRRGTTSTRSDYFEDDFDADYVFRSFFFGSHDDVYRARYTPRTRAAPRPQRNTNDHEGEFSFSSLLHFVPFLVMFLLLYLPLSEPEYALQKSYSFQIPKVIEIYGLEFYVKSPDFDTKYPPGSPARANLEYNVLRDYKGMLARYCHVERQRRQWARNYPTPHCDKLRSFGIA